MSQPNEPLQRMLAAANSVQRSLILPDYAKVAITAAVEVIARQEGQIRELREQVERLQRAILIANIPPADIPLVCDLASEGGVSQ